MTTLTLIPCRQVSPCTLGPSMPAASGTATLAVVSRTRPSLTAGFPPVLISNTNPTQPTAGLPIPGLSHGRRVAIPSGGAPLRQMATEERKVISLNSTCRRDPGTGIEGQYPSSRSAGHITTLRPAKVVRMCARKEIPMGGPSRTLRLVDTAGSALDRFEQDAREIADAVKDGVTTAAEVTRILDVLARTQASLASTYTEAQLHADAMTLVHEVSGAGAVTPWVSRRSREKHSDYLRLLDQPAKPSNVIAFPAPNNGPRAA